MSLTVLCDIIYISIHIIAVVIDQIIACIRYTYVIMKTSQPASEQIVIRVSHSCLVWFHVDLLLTYLVVNCLQIDRIFRGSKGQFSH